MTGGGECHTVPVSRRFIAAPSDPALAAAYELLLASRWTILSWMAANPGPRTTREIAAGVDANVDSTHNTLTVLSQISVVSGVRLTGDVDPLRPIQWERNEAVTRFLVDALTSAILPR